MIILFNLELLACISITLTFEGNINKREQSGKNYAVNIYQLFLRNSLILETQLGKTIGFHLILIISYLKSLQKAILKQFPQNLKVSRKIVQMIQKKTLYEDDTVTITNQDINIHLYYFPLPMSKTINMCDIKQVNLKTDVNKHQQYIEIVVKGFSMNATFSPSDPKKVLQTIKFNSCYNLPEKNITEKKQELKKEAEKAEQKVKEKKEQLKQGAKQLKQEASNKIQEGKKQVQDQSLLENIQNKLAYGWQEIKQVSTNIYQAATQKIHEMTAPQTQKKVKSVKQDIKKGAQQLKEDAKETLKQGKQQIKMATEPQKSTYESVKESAAKQWQDLKEGAQNVYEKATEKVSQIAGTDAQSKAKKAKQEFKQGAKDTKQSIEKATKTEKPLTEQAKEKVQQWTGTDAKGKAEDAKKHFKKGTEDAVQSAKKATGYQGSALQNAKQNLAQGWQDTKQNIKKAYDSTAKKASQFGSNIQKKVGQTTQQAGNVLKQKGNQMQKNK